MMFRCLVIAFALVAACQAKSVVTDCGGPDAYIKFEKLDITPMPFNILGKIEVEGEVEILKQMSYEVSLSVNLTKSNLGGDFVWEIPCTNYGSCPFFGDKLNLYFGTCEYKGSCDFPFIKDWVSNNACPSFFKEYEIPCTCPFPRMKFATKEPVEVDLAPFNYHLPSWFIEGEYKAEIKLRDKTDGNKLMGCFTLDFDVNARVECDEVLKALNACPDY